MMIKAMWRERMRYPWSEQMVESAPQGTSASRSQEEEILQRNPGERKRTFHERQNAQLLSEKGEVR